MLCLLGLKIDLCPCLVGSVLECLLGKELGSNELIVRSKSLKILIFPLRISILKSFENNLCLLLRSVFFSYCLLSGS